MCTGDMSSVSFQNEVNETTSFNLLSQQTMKSKFEL